MRFNNHQPISIHHRLYLAGIIPTACLIGCATTTITPDYVYFPPTPAKPRIVHLKSFNDLRSLVPRRDTFREAVSGGALSPRVSTPAGLAYASDTLYICDTNQNVVHAWNLQTGQARQIGGGGGRGSGRAALMEPVAVAVNPSSGSVFVADTGREEVISYQADGQFNQTYKPPDRKEYRPVSVAIHGDRLFVTDIAAHRVDVYSIGDAALENSFGGVGTQPGKFFYPMGVATFADGRLAVSDMMNARVQLFDTYLKIVRYFGSPGQHLGNFGQPRHLTVSPDDVIFIADAQFASVHLFNDRGQLLMMLGHADDSSDQPGSTPMPVGVTIAPSVPEPVQSLVPQDFHADYFLFVASTTGRRRISLFAVGHSSVSVAPVASSTR